MIGSAWTVRLRGGGRDCDRTSTVRQEGADDFHQFQGPWARVISTSVPIGYGLGIKGTSTSPAFSYTRRVEGRSRAGTFTLCTSGKAVLARA
jgi:hypothetical protein